MLELAAQTLNAVMWLLDICRCMNPLRLNVTCVFKASQDVTITRDSYKEGGEGSITGTPLRAHAIYPTNGIKKEIAVS